ncbi:hypothetical protein P43SY_003146 [Pythium insidiosum]|uniref:Mic1 domain-containing protein n=1 Tax=Pythium insidiosum TaxID=114742 RepID=A0AAD5LVJ9_PYTIN|nr:hypothetical protein P43SY_003146 [Pythium insidiosum]
MMSDGHLFLSESCCAATAFDSRFVWYDAAHDSQLVFSQPAQSVLELALPPSGATATATQAVAAEAEAVAVPPPAATAGDTTLLYRGAAVREPLALLRLSVDRCFLAVQKSDVEVQVLCLATGESHWIVCKPTSGNRIVSDGLIWSTHAAGPQRSQDLFLITKLGIEQYRVSRKRRDCTLHRTIAVFVHTFWHSAAHGVLIVSTGARANELVPFQLCASNVEKLPRLVFSTPVRPRELFLASLYGELYAVYSDTRSMRLLLYLVGRAKVSCVRSLHVQLPPGTAVEFSVVDNLLVCHGIEFNVSLFFDVKCESELHEPFSHPLPISLGPPRGVSLGKAPSVDTSDPVRDEHRVDATTLLLQHPLREPDSHAGSHWRFVSPDLVQRVDGGHDLRRLRLNLVAVGRSCARHPEILPFLLRRGDMALAKTLALTLVRDRLSEHALPPAAVSALLGAIQTVSRSELEELATDSSATATSEDDDSSSLSVALRTKLFGSGRARVQDTALPTRNARGLALVLQHDVCRHQVVAAGHLSTYLCEYVRLLRHHEVPVETVTFLALAHAFLASHNAHKLCQLLHYHVPSDSVELAQLLLQHRLDEPALAQLALDMLTRLGTLAPLIVALLDLDDVDRAIATAWQFLGSPECDASIVSAAAFFDAMARCLRALPAPRSTLLLHQRLHTLVLFLRVWDPSSLVAPSSHMSPLAATSAIGL